MKIKMNNATNNQKSAIIKLVMKMKVTIGVSVRHVHLTEEDYKELFNEDLTVKVPINQPGQFAANQTVTLEANNKKLEHIRVIGPCRSYTQVEISRTDAYYFKITPPVRESGNLTAAEKIKIIGPKGQIERNACVISDRHIHITSEERKKYNLTKDKYQVRINGEKGGIMDNVFIREADNSFYEMHIDSDDANAFDLKQNDEVEILL